MNWTRGRTIGVGSSATVSLARFCDSGEIFAVKSASLAHSHSLQVEQELLSTLSCAQLVSYKGCNISTENGNVLYNLCLEYAPAGTLSDEVRRQGGSFSESTMRSYTRQILLGMEYLHANGIVHCDIKGRNILMTDEGAKLADFGCARRVNGDHGSYTISGTPLYLAPEAARGEQQGFPADVWALGCTIIEMATGQAPWPTLSDPVSGLYRIGFSVDVPEIPSSLSKQGMEFVSKCLRRDPLERWSASELLKHPFLLGEEEPCCWNSPTTVLDYDLWDLEKFDDMEWEQSTCSNSARERIRRLSEEKADTASLSGGMLSWACDGDWVTVRSNKEVDTLPQNVDQDYEDEATNTDSSASSIGLGLGTDNGSFRRDMKCGSLKASNSKCRENMYCVNSNFHNEEFWFFVHDIHPYLMMTICL
ncbi:mitogen-activated protein kinase kinase kinase 18-like [Argentina anserina]|uniref:mitogen-activated protein kinase kinase kinase 18-like n=1 Tax=Argentina anserina TaxID=57926 RepID=UPI00217667B1|nr:mitogen-activated protein kinase kinase kinase 18-like [Potentilla anserina]